MTSIYEKIPTLFSTSDPRYLILLFLLAIIVFVLRTKKAWLSDNLKSFAGNANDLNFLSKTIRIAAGIVISIFIFDFLFITTHYEKLGVMGDFFGGIVNPILTFLTFSGLLITIAMQRDGAIKSEKDHADNKIQLNIHAFETTFFSMIELHHKIVESIRINVDYIRSINDEQNVISGKFKRTILNIINQRTTLEDYSVKTIKFTALTEDITGRAAIKIILDFVTKEDNPTKSKDYYKFIQNNANGILGHYFRNLYQIIKLINDNQDLDELQRKKYANIARAQLSQEELCLLLLNCLPKVVDNGSFADLLIKWQFLEHVQLEKDSTKDWYKMKMGKYICTAEDIDYYKMKDKTKKEDYTPRGAFGNNIDIR